MAYCENCGAKLPEHKAEPGHENQPGEVHIKCPACGFIHWKNPGPCVSVLVVREGRVLLGRRTETDTDIMPGKWCLPCGFIEWGENYYDAAKREVLEETGLTVRPVSIINVVSNHFGPGTFGDQYPAKKYESLVVVLLAVPVSGEERAGDDLTEIEWFPAEGPLPEMAFQADTHTIGQYRRFGDRFGIAFSDTEDVFWE